MASIKFRMRVKTNAGAQNNAHEKPLHKCITIWPVNFFSSFFVDHFSVSHEFISEMYTNYRHQLPLAMILASDGEREWEREKGREIKKQSLNKKQTNNFFILFAPFFSPFSCCWHFIACISFYDGHAAFFFRSASSVPRRMCVKRLGAQLNVI